MRLSEVDIMCFKFALDEGINNVFFPMPAKKNDIPFNLSESLSLVKKISD